MDILGMVNDYIKNNKSDDQLAHEFKSLFNKGNSIEKIAKQYDYSPEKVRTIIDQSELSKSNSELKSGIEPKISTSSSKKEESIIDKKKELKISIDIVVDVLNDGVDLDEVAKQYNITGTQLKQQILLDGYRYNSFMNYWTKMNQEELVDYLVREVNQGYTLYDLSAKYVKTNKDRLSFVYKVESYLKKYKYQYNLTKKKWTRGDQPTPTGGHSKLDSKPVPTTNLKKIVMELNKGIPMKDVVESLKITTNSLRQDLKKNGYRFDRVFDVWTQEKRSELVKKLDDDLSKGIVTIEDLKNRGLNTKILEVELKFAGFDDNLIRHVQKNKTPKSFVENTKVEKKALVNKLTSKVDTAKIQLHSELSTQSKYKPSTNTELFSKEEVADLKEMINIWQQKKKESRLVKDAKEINIYIEEDLLMQLTNASELSGISRSLVIANALKEYLKK
ncbi:hypothetical protein [Neobacillus drentensis]|uniref:hypothetical protein n=1 Tax=Neobacillus drentensis TaxID=220684 RepID=UPI003000DF7B